MEKNNSGENRTGEVGNKVLLRVVRKQNRVLFPLSNEASFSQMQEDRILLFAPF